MARYDKYDPIAGGFRAKLAADLTLTAGSVGPVAVSLDSAGKVVVGTAGQSGCVGILVKNAAKGPLTSWSTDLMGGTPNPYAPIGCKAGDIVDIMTSGEIVEVTGLTPGQKVFAAANGTLSTTTGSGKVLVGWTVEAGRLVVRTAGSVAALP